MNRTIWRNRSRRAACFSLYTQQKQRKLLVFGRTAYSIELFRLRFSMDHFFLLLPPQPRVCVFGNNCAAVAADVEYFCVKCDENRCKKFHIKQMEWLSTMCAAIVTPGAHNSRLGPITNACIHIEIPKGAGKEIAKAFITELTDWIEFDVKHPAVTAINFELTVYVLSSLLVTILIGRTHNSQLIPTNPLSN